MSKVEILVGTSVGCTDTSAPYSCSYNTRNLSSGARVLTARAYDAAGNITLSSAVNVVFDNDLAAPTSSITSPSAGAILKGTVLVEATANDDRGTVSKVELYLGSTLLGTVTTAPYSFSWDTTTRANGSYLLKTRAYDPTGNYANSANVSVTVSN
ncbi:hypothetical protein JRI60_50655 [Archangium violaceum]|nr:hypothetical protein JRI60_50655 [Archangium violaceum]